MKYNGIIESKLRVIEEKLTDIEGWQIKSLEQLKQSSMLRNGILFTKLEIAEWYGQIKVLVIEYLNRPNLFNSLTLMTLTLNPSPKRARDFGSCKSSSPLCLERGWG